MKNIGRTVVFTAMVGSHNYNLARPDSDRDYKVFFLPDFSDLYRGKHHQPPSEVGVEVDYEYHDIRKMVELFWKANVNFLEVLFSKDKAAPGMHPEIVEIWHMRDAIARMNLPYLYNACIGMYHNKVKLLEHGTAGTKHLVEAFGYDTKQAMHAYRILDFVQRFADNHFTDFGAAIEYDKAGRDKLLDIKDGLYTLNQFLDLAHEKWSDCDRLFSGFYHDQEPDEATKAVLDDLIYQMVERHITGGVQA